MPMSSSPKPSGDVETDIWATKGAVFEGQLLSHAVNGHLRTQIPAPFTCCSYREDGRPHEIAIAFLRRPPSCDRKAEWVLVRNTPSTFKSNRAESILSKRAILKERRLLVAVVSISLAVENHAFGSSR
jgi:hypothetical protein